MDFEQAQARKLPVVVSVPLVLDTKWAEELHAQTRKVNDLDKEVEQARHRASIFGDNQEYRDKADDLADTLDTERAALEALRAESEDKMITFRFRALAAHEYDDLVKKHPPTDEMRRESKRLHLPPPAWHGESFPPALVAAALIEPKWTGEQIAQIWRDDQWNAAELRALYEAADRAVSSRPVVDLGEG